MSNEYKDLSVFNALKQINSGDIIIPDIQREYCWSPSDIIELFKSIIEEYPIGSFIFWKAKGEQLNNCTSDFYDFLHTVWRKKDGFFQPENKLLSKIFENNKIYDVVLDGQQRLSSLFLVFKGEYNFKKPGRGHDDKESNYEPKELYYIYNWDIDNEDADKDEPFQFLTQEEANDKECYRVKELLKYKNYEEFCTTIDELTINMSNKTSIRKYLKTLFKRLDNESQNESLIHYFTISSDKFDDALDVFVRVNSTGKKLNKTDLLFGTLINKWPKENGDYDGRRKEIEKFLKHINEKYHFGFNKDFLLRTCLVLVNDGKSGITMQELAKTKTIENIRTKWDAIKKTFEKCSAIMKDIDLDDEKILSYNAIIPIMFYLYNGGKIHDYLEREELRKYFAVSFAKGLFGGSSNTAITNTCNSIKDNIKNKFSIKFFEKTEFSGGRNFHVDIQLINRWLETYNKGAKTYFILMLLSPNLNLLEDNYDQDHSHADTLFNDSTLKENNVPETRISLWKEKRNHLPNLSFMQESRNRSKNKTDLATWIRENPDKVSSLKLLPIDTSYGLANFEHFYVLRRSLMKYVLTSKFDVEKEAIKVGDEVTLNTSIQKGEFGNTENMLFGMHGHVTDVNGLSYFKGGKMVQTVFVKFENDNRIIFGQYVPTQFLYLVEPFDKEMNI